ncbi:MAG TPA: hypothetical protein VFB04_05455 [Terriglobales bacterium]|nr:hypothetical protein [Terriglobales bacterium]
MDFAAIMGCKRLTACGLQHDVAKCIAQEIAFRNSEISCDLQHRFGEGWVSAVAIPSARSRISKLALVRSRDEML